VPTEQFDFLKGETVNQLWFWGEIRLVVEEASAEGGVLRLRFTNGMILEAPPNERYESWSVSGPSGTTACLPGGETASW
jgi:hypothetical protein